MRENSSMKRGSTLFLKIVIGLIGLGVLAIMLWVPPHEGVNAGVDLLTVYFKDPFLAYAYLSSVPFFVALYQGIKLLNLIDINQAFSQLAVKTLRTIKYCAMLLAASIFGAQLYIRFGTPAEDGNPLGLYLTFVAIVVATAVAVAEKLLQNAVDLKSENDLTV